MNKKLTMEAIAVIDSLLHQIGQMSGMFDDEDGTIEEAVEGAVEIQAKLRAAPDNAEAVALDRIRARLAGEWFDPTGDLESDIKSVLRELDGTAEPDDEDESEDSNDNPFDPESPEGRAVDRGDMNPDGSSPPRGGDTQLPQANVGEPADIKELRRQLAAAEGRAKNATSNLEYWKGQYEALIAKAPQPGADTADA